VKKGPLSWFMKAVSLLPLGLSRVLGGMIGRLGWWFNSRAAKTTLRNLELCMPQLDQRQRRDLARRSMQQTGVMLLETPAVWMRDIDWVNRRILAVTGKDIVERAIAEKRGVIVIAPHIGNWEVAGLYIAGFGDITCLYQPPKNPEMNEIIKSSRESMGVKLAPTNRRGVMTLFKAIKQGGMTGILPDQVPDEGSGMMSEFFAQPCKTMTLVCTLIQKTGCAAVVAYAQRVPGGFSMVFKQPHADIFSDELETAVKGLDLSVQDCVEDIPEQYQWEYKRLRRVTRGVDPYK